MEISQSSNGGRLPRDKTPRYKNIIHLWEFLLELLANKNLSNIISWSRREFREFTLKKPDEVSRRWGIVKGRKDMNYQKLSRALRFYYGQGIIQKVPGQTFTYRFNKLPYNYEPSKARPLHHRCMLAASTHEITRDNCTAPLINTNSLSGQAVIEPTCTPWGNCQPTGTPWEIGHSWSLVPKNTTPDKCTPPQINKYSSSGQTEFSPTGIPWGNCHPSSLVTEHIKLDNCTPPQINTKLSSGQPAFPSTGTPWGNCHSWSLLHVPKQELAVCMYHQSVPYPTPKIHDSVNVCRADHYHAVNVSSNGPRPSLHTSKANSIPVSVIKRVKSTPSTDTRFNVSDSSFCCISDVRSLITCSL